MAVHYRFETDTGVHERRLQIPESPTERLHGETYPQEVIDSLHESERNIIEALVALRTTKYGTELVRAWAE